MKTRKPGAHVGARCKFHPAGCPADCLISDTWLELEYRGAMLAERARQGRGEPETFADLGPSIDRLLNLIIPRRIERRHEAEWMAEEIRDAGGSLGVRHGRLAVDLGGLPDEFVDDCERLRPELEEIADEVARRNSELQPAEDQRLARPALEQAG